MNPFENAGLSCGGASTSELFRKGIGPGSFRRHQSQGEGRTQNRNSAPRKTVVCCVGIKPRQG